MIFETGVFFFFFLILTYISYRASRGRNTFDYIRGQKGFRLYLKMGNPTPEKSAKISSYALNKVTKWVSVKGHGEVLGILDFGVLRREGIGEKEGQGNVLEHKLY